MRVFPAPKRHRVSRGNTLRGSSGVLAEAIAALTDRNRLLRLLIGFVGACLLLLALQSWRYPFTHRLGDRFPNGLSARITFRVENELERQRVGREREQEVPFLFRNNPENLEQLPARLLGSLGAVAEADSVMELPNEVRVAFGLILPDETPAETPAVTVGETPQTTPADEIEYRFRQLKQAITPLDGLRSETYISSIIDEFARLLEPLYRKGLLDPETLERSAIGRDARIAVVDQSAELPAENPLADERLWIPVRTTDVLLSDLLNDTGYLSQRWSNFPTLETIRQPLEQWLRTQARPTLKYDQIATQSARRWAGSQVEPVFDIVNAGDQFLGPGGIIDQPLLPILYAEYASSIERETFEESFLRALLVLLLIVLLLALTNWYLQRYEPTIFENWPRLLTFFCVLAAAAFLGRITSLDPARGEAAIVVATAMIVGIVYNQRFAIVTAFVLSLLICVSTRIEMSQFSVMFAAAMVAITQLKRVQSRQALIVSGLFAAAAAFLVGWGTTALLNPTGSISDWFAPSVLLITLKSAGWCLLAGFIVSGSLPFIEATFGVVTGTSLLEMSDSSHPLLQELFRKAPGTYNHSIAVATIAETAAKCIGANGLLVRVGAYFHDIGKIPKAEYFIENRSTGAVNLHDSLAPTMSTLIIIGHVKDGVDLAEEYHLPQVLVDFIEQHHGTTLVEFFYHAANKRAGGEPERQAEVAEANFRYPGPKPQTKEAGVLMLADCVESASRTLSEPTPARISHLVHSLTMKRLLDGQFEECNLTLSEIHQIEESLVKSLISIYHGRISYPAQTTEQKSA